VKTCRHIAIALAIAVVGAGCATLGGPSDEELVADVMAQWETAMESGTADEIIALYSENYQGTRGYGRDEWKSMLERFLPRVRQQGVKMADTSEMVISVEGDTATAGPITFGSGRRSMKMQLTLTKEADGVWRITKSGTAE